MPLISRAYHFFLDRWNQLPSKGRNAIAICLIAIGVGFTAVTFHNLVEMIAEHTYMRFAEVGGVWFAIGTFVCVVGCSLLATLLINQFSPSSAGGGVMPTKLAFWKDFGMMPMRTAIVKFIASALTLGGGVSMGPEGPVVQIGASAASASAGMVGFAKQKRRLFCAGGAAAALAAVFNAPLAAITFVLEEIIGDLSSKLIGGILLASVVGALVADAMIGSQPAFTVKPLEQPSWWGVMLCPFAAAAASFGGAGFQRGTLYVRGRLKLANKLPSWSRPTIGALGTWVLGGIAFYATGHIGVFGIGYSDVSACIRGDLPWNVTLILGLCKLGATFLAVGTSGCGGIFAPSFFLGAMFGGTVGKLAGLFLPLTSSDQSMLVMAGMCAGFIAVIRTPLTCILLIFEVTHQFVIVPFLLLATLVSQVISRKLLHEDMYESMLIQDGENPHHVLPPRDFRKWREMPVGALASYRPIVATDVSPNGLTELLSKYRYQCFPVQSPDGAVLGLITRSEAEHVIATGMEPKLEKVVWVNAEESLGKIQHQLIESPSNFVLLGNAEQKRLAGVFTLHDLLRGQEALLEDQEDD